MSLPKHPSTAFLATYQHLQSCTLSLKESRRAQPKAANSQHLVQAGAVRGYRRRSWYRRGGRRLAACAIRLLKNHPHRVLSRMGGKQTVSFQHGGPLKPAVDPLLSNQTAPVSYDANF